MNRPIITPDKISLFHRHLAYCERSPATVEKYVRDVSAFARYAKGQPITKETVVSYKNLINGRYAVRSVNSMLAGLNSFFEFIARPELKVKSLKL